MNKLLSAKVCLRTALLVLFVSLMCMQNLIADNLSKQPKGESVPTHDIQVLLHEYATKNNTTIIVDPKAGATVRLYGKEPADVSEADLHAILNVHGLSMVKVDQLYVVKPTEFAKHSGLEVMVNGDKSAHGSQLVTTIISPKHIPASQLIPILRPLIPQHGHFAAFAASNKLILTDTYDNVQRITDIVNELDTKRQVNENKSLKK